MSFGILKEKLDCGDLRKCGEVATRISVGKKEAYLNCDFCNCSYSQLDYFIQHVYEKHLYEIEMLNLKQEYTDCGFQSDEENEFVKTGMQLESSIEPNDGDQEIVLRGFEKVEIELDSSGLNDSLDTEQIEPKEILKVESPRIYETSNEESSQDKPDETDSDSEMDWNTPFGLNKENKKHTRKQFIIEFIGVYRTLPALWDINSTAYQDLRLRNEQYEILFKKYKEKYPNATLKLVKDKIRSLRSQYRRAVKSTATSGISTLYYYDAMNFLHDIQPRSEDQNDVQAFDEGQHSIEEDDVMSPPVENCESDTDSGTTDTEEEMDTRENNKKSKKNVEISQKRKFVLEFIKEYQSLPALWNTKCSDYHNRTLKNKQYETLIGKYKEKYPKANKEDVKRKISSLRTNFRRVSKKRGKKNLYYYDALTFLLQHSQPDPKKKAHDIEESEELKLEAIAAPESLLTEAQCTKLANIYESYTCLWDENDIAYRFANRRREARITIQEEFNKTTGLNLTKNDLEKEITRLRKICSNEKKQKIACRRKNIDYKSECPYYDQIAFLEVDVTPYECSICGKIIAGICQYKVHLASHDGTLPFKCHVCGHGFKLATNLTVHLRRHVQDFTYSCGICNKPCATTTELKIHIRLHTGEKPYICHVCGKAFGCNSELRSHMERSHEKLKPHKCEICSKAFYEKQKLRDHINVHLNLRENICDVCDKGFTSRKLLRHHILIHSEEKKHLCKICGKRFAQSAGLNSHMKSHGTKL